MSDLCGKSNQIKNILSIFEASIQTDYAFEKNPDPALRTRKAYEIVVAKNLKYNEKKQRWETKELYHPSYGKYFSAYMEFESATRLKVRGYVGAPALGQTEYWEKTE